jgi:4-hydroxy-2-oxoheptanedioate aldolase
MEGAMILENPLKKTLKAGGCVIGTMIQHLRVPAVAVMMKNAGWDFVFVDCEHGSFSPESLADFCIAARGANLPTIVRVPSIHEHQRLYQTLDLGATGLLCPQTETREEVEAILQATKYSPRGHRGMAMRNVHTSWGRYQGSELLPRLNQETMIVLQIESARGVENLEQLVSVPGVDAVFIGPNDLSQSLGVPGDANHPEVAKQVERALKACRRTEIPCGIHTFDVESAKEWIRKGMRFMGCGGEVTWLVDAGQRATAEIKASFPSQ